MNQQKPLEAIRILFPIGTLYPSQEGGPSNTIYWMAKALVRNGVSVTIVTTNSGAEGKVSADQWMNTDYGRVIYHSSKVHLLPQRMMRSTIAAVKQCDVAHLSSVFYPPSLVAALAARWYGKPVIWSPRGELDEKALVFSAWKKKPFLWFIRHFLAKKTAFHSTSPEETGRIRAVLGHNVQVLEIPNFMEIPHPIEPAPGKPYLLCLGRIHPKKALENLISAVTLSRQFMQSDFILKIAGNDQNTYGQKLKKQVAEFGLQERIEFTGLVEGEDKQRLYAGAYFSILPSHTENFGNVVIESLAQGTPVIASKGTPWAMLENEMAGFWTDNSPGALAQAIDSALSLPPEIELKYRKNAATLVQQHFDIGQKIKIWINIYQTLSVLNSSEN